MRALPCLAAMLALAVAGEVRGQPSATPSPEAKMPAPIVFFDIAGPDLKSQAAFYRAIFGWDVGPDGRFSAPVVSPLMGNLRVEDPAQGPVAERVVYIGVPDITATLRQVSDHGGSIVFPRLEVPGVAVVALFKDPAGNRMGLVEMDGDHARIPPKPAP